MADVPKSETFDITLIITLLRYLTSIYPPSGGFDRLPSAMETAPYSDLARIKYYKNLVAHNSDGKVDTTVFRTAWEDLSRVSYIMFYRSSVFFKFFFFLIFIECFTPN